MNEIIIVTGGEIDDTLVSDSINHSENPYIIGVDKGIEALERLNIKPDLLIGDFDSAGESIKKKYAPDERTIILNPEKNLTDTHAALIEAVKLAKKNKSSITILGATGKRIDHLLGNIGILRYCLDNNIDACIIDRYNKIRMMDKNKDIIIKEKDLYGKFISLIPFTDKVEGIMLEGFKYIPKGGVLVKDDTLGISNELIKEEGRISIKSGYLLLLETGD
ncbi:MAG: thiamine diphosphokinase [Lachnospiraceae bacterium]|nr:thiamine diphosphokinase [Lachnospiraceae bacterium]MBQ9233436.1 thiamine diphosphokinase [Lachnospiraceae bacterium]